MDTPKAVEPPTQTERLAYSIQEAACLLGVNYFSVYRLVQRGKLKACRALRGKLLVPRSELLKLLNVTLRTFPWTCSQVEPCWKPRGLRTGWW